MVPLWLDDELEPLPRVRLAGAADVAVIGGGVTGCACALALAEGGLRVRLHEAHEVASGASGRNGGFALRGGAMPYDVARTQLGRLVLGGRRDVALDAEWTSEETVTEEIQAALDGLLERLVGGMPRVTHRWSGIFGTVADRMPLAGPVPGRDGVWVACGYSGHGNVLGLVCGELVAAAILGAPAPELKLFDPARLLRLEVRNAV